MTRGWWIVIGALGGACILGFAALLVRVSDPEYWAPYWLMVGPVAGLILGGLLGSRALGIKARPARAAIGALCGAAIFATVGGFVFLFGGLRSPEGAFHGLRNFAIGAIVGGITGLVAGGYIGGRTAGSNREVS